MKSVISFSKIIAAITAVIVFLWMIIQSTTVVNNFIHAQNLLLEAQKEFAQNQKKIQEDLNILRQATASQLAVLDEKKRDKGDAWSRFQMNLLWTDAEKALSTPLPDVLSDRYDSRN